MSKDPQTLQEAVLTFANPDNCREYLVPRRWAKGEVRCPVCGSDRVSYQAKHNRWQCSNRHPKRTFTLKTGTVMEDSPIGIDKWLMAMWLVASNRNGISSWELSRALDITQKTAWFLLHRIRLAMQDEQHGGKLGGEVEVDETFIGGKACNMHKSKRQRMGISGPAGPTAGSKAIVHGILERGKTVRALSAAPT
jgi:transposase-like protein